MKKKVSLVIFLKGFFAKRFFLKKAKKSNFFVKQKQKVFSLYNLNNIYSKIFF